MSRLSAEALKVELGKQTTKSMTTNYLPIEVYTFDFCLNYEFHF